MEYKVLFSILCFIVWEVNSMALKGPVLTTYHPCGLGLLRFDRKSANNWQGAVELGLYNNLKEADIVMKFKYETTVLSKNSAFNITVSRLNKHYFKVHASQPMPEKYVFIVWLDHISANKSDVPVVTELILNNVTLCNDQIKASQTISSLNVTQKYSENQYAHVCGRRSFDHEELISLRTEAKPGDWPWHVAIFRNDDDGLSYACGGNIVSRTAIVTAGHCAFSNGVLLEANQVVIVAGSSNHKDINHGRQELNAERIIVHPAYNSEYSTSDLAIIRVRSLKFTEFVRPICLWGPVYDKKSIVGKEATVVGFGSTENNTQSDALRSTYTMVQNNTVCVVSSPKAYKKLMNEFTLCAGYGPTSRINPRNGDSGGGLVVPTIQGDHKISWFLRGVLSKCGISAGHTECDPKYYVVYTDVAPHYGWIYHHAGVQFRSNILMS